METKEKQSPFAHIAQQTVTEAKLTMFRNFCVGGSATCLLIILTIAQGQLRSDAIDISERAASVGMPLWFAMSGIVELYITEGERSYAHYQSEKMQKYFGLILTAAGIALLVSLGSLLYHLNPTNLWFFGPAAFVAAIIAGSFAEIAGR